MKKIANILVEKRIVILIFFVIFTVASIWMMTKVKLNSDMTQYLPDDSSTKKGTEIMLDEFPAGSSFNIMFKHLSDIERLAIRSELEEIPYVRSVSYEPDSDLYNQDSYTLYTVNLSVNAYTPAVEAVTDTIKNEFKGYDITMSGDALGNSSKDIIPKLAVIAFVILMIILFIMCSSWVEPFLFLATIAIAIVINMGTNIIFPNVSEVTNSISAVLQLVLSMDYSIMLLNRYRQEKEKTADKFEAMKMALAGAATSISSSSVTTVVGMLALCFMSFKIGSDMGLVLAKGVLLSLICIFTVLTALILIFDKAIERTAKPAFHIKMDAIGKFSFWARKAIPVFFVLLFIGAFFLRGKVGIAYTMSDYYEINKIFSPKNNIVVLYDNADEDKIATLAQDWEENGDIDTVNAYSTTLGREMTYDEMAEAPDMETSMVAQMYNSYFAYHPEVGTSTSPEKIVLTDFLQFLQNNVAVNPQYAELMPSDMAQQLVTSMQQIPQQMMAQEMTAAEMATTLQMDFPIVEQLYSFYAISKGDMPQGKIAIYDFMQFIID
ncbi:MAG: MMPL family transporter, partial [Clostridiaceae bacterium]|nr:MMPL family transporter [Clostridiaceae bacterium]